MAKIVDQFSRTARAVNPAWAGDYISREHNLPGGARVDPAAFPAIAEHTVTLAALAAEGATSLTTDALAQPIRAGTVLVFDSGDAVVTADVAAAATAISVEPLAVGLADNETAVVPRQLSIVRSGTLVGRTFAERAAGTAFGVAADTDDEIYLVIWDNPNVADDPDVELYRHGSLVKENYLPGWAALSAGLKAEVRALYQTTTGVEY
jgi:hypothetical protein